MLRRQSTSLFRYVDYLFFKDTLEKGGALSRTIFFVHTASDPIVESLMVPDISLAVAEGFALQGKKVLQTEFVAVNRREIVWMGPEENMQKSEEMMGS